MPRMTFEEIWGRMHGARASFAKSSELWLERYIRSITPPLTETNLCSSPIEVMFAAAWFSKMMEYRVLNRCGRGHRFDIHPPGKGDLAVPMSEPNLSRLDICCCQHRVGKYAADFAMVRASWVEDGTRLVSPRVIVECDGHDYHDRTKQQAQRDKERDRFLQSNGYYVLRFTGSELWKDAGACVAQVDDLLNNSISDQIVKKHFGNE